jgi:hypothetical protein
MRRIKLKCESYKNIKKANEIIHYFCMKKTYGEKIKKIRKIIFFSFSRSKFLFFFFLDERKKKKIV